jgi:plastocyanin domain-containing protein
MTVGAALVVFLGLSMFSQGFTLSGLSLDFLSGAAADNAAEAEAARMEDGYQIVAGTLQPGSYPAITVRAGIPVKWTIDAPKGSINGCNNRMLIPAFGVEHSFTTGANLIEFTPTETGRFPYSCWMGMIRSSVTVVAADATPDETGAYADGAESEFPYVEGAYAEDADPIPANVEIPTEALAIAEFETVVIEGESYDIQRVSVELSDDGYSPAVIVVQAGLDAEWTVDNTSSAEDNLTMLVPYYGTRLDLKPGKNPLYLFPTEYFSFSNGDNSFYGYVKVVDDLSTVDEAAIKAEAAAFETLIYPPETFLAGASRRCH